MKKSQSKGSVRLRVGRGVMCYNLPRAAKAKIRRDLSFDNPEYVSAEKAGRYISSDVEPKLDLYVSSKKKWWVPRGYLRFLIRWLKENKFDKVIDDRTLVLEPLDIEFTGTLRDYQKKAFRDVRSYPVGVLEAGTGAGKTVMGIAIMASRKQPTLIVVHSKELLYQWVDQIKKFTGYEAGIVGDGKFKVKPITVGIINSVRNKCDELVPLFGGVIIDECHRCPSGTWADTIQEFPAKYYLGLTATPFRRDGLGHAIFASIGPLLHKVNKTMLQEIGAVLKPDVIRVLTDYGREMDYLADGYSRTIKYLCEDEQRNLKISYQIRSDLKKNKQNVLVVSDRKYHCDLIQKALHKIGVESVVLTGGTKGKERKGTVEKVKSGKCRVLIATTSLIGEGFDAPSLSALFLCTPIKFAGRILQTVGRVLRPSDGAKPRLYDFRDNNISALRYSGYGRDRVYHKEGWL